MLVRGDQQRLRQIVINLLGNAVKFTHDGQYRAGMPIGTATSEAAVPALEVTDTGIGIPGGSHRPAF